MVCGQLINRDSRSIIGISVARKNPRGQEIVLKSISDYLCEQKICVADDIIKEATVFIDDYVGDGYGSDSLEVKKVIEFVMENYGVPLDFVYTGKAFAGMIDYLKNSIIKNKNVLFIHTGGIPLFFDGLRKFYDKNNI